MKKVSVLMTVYNGVEYLKDSIDSILNQTYEEFDFIIIDDKSVDGSLDFIKSIKDSRIIVVRNKENIGQTFFFLGVFLLGAIAASLPLLLLRTLAISFSSHIFCQ